MSVQPKNILVVMMPIFMTLSCGCVARQLDFTHVVVGENVGGRTAIGDMDLDGDIDIVAGTLIRTSTPEICIFLNQGKGRNWNKKIVAVTSSYKAKTGDMDNDGDIDIVTARSWDKAPIQLWRNTIKD